MVETGPPPPQIHSPFSKASEAKMPSRRVVAAAFSLAVMMLLCVGPASSQAPTSPVPRDDVPGLKESVMDTVMKLLPNLNPLKV